MKTWYHSTSSIKIISADERFVKFVENKKALEVLLERFDPFINIEVERRANGLSLEKRNEIKQNVRIKLWRALQVRIIQFPPAYLRTIIKNEFNDLGRRHKFPEQLSLDDYGEVKQGQILVNLSEEWGNPEHIVEQSDDVANLLNAAVEAISGLPHRQQLAMVCSLLERVDDVILLKKIFELHQVHIEMEDWPNDEMDVRRLKALISVARRKIARFMSRSTTISGRDVYDASLFFCENDIKS
ncbi:MAG TPA: hypothetical protein VEU97_18140 [Ktedonobacteraceae bacterium]|nr:hypothetical protein [Ktedonobacteraceae bacterium]